MRDCSILFSNSNFMVTRLIFNIVPIFLALGACNRSAHIEKSIDKEENIYQQEISLIENHASVEKDIHHLLKQGYEKAGTKYDSVKFNLYHTPALMDSIKIESNGENIVRFYLGNKNNRVVAYYSYLDVLGFRFYGPDDHWTHIPEVNFEMPIDTLIASNFKYRVLSPSYGVSRYNIQALDSAQYLYSRWMNRLRMANLIHIPSGHYGSSFNRKFKKQIESNPSWRGQDHNGNSRSWSVNLKLCYNNPDVIHLYKIDALERIEKLKKNSSAPYIINMEPPDGGNFCQCNTCQHLTVSDQVYSLANKVAEYIYQKDTNAYVSLYAYNKHAEVPSFELKKNIIIGVVPYALQSFGSPETIMKRWESTGAKLFLRDYLSIPDWTQNRPTYQINGSFMNKINNILNNDYLGYNFETTASFMSVGLQFYLLSQASWKEIDETTEFDQFLIHLFNGLKEEVSIIYQNLPHLDNRTYASAQEMTRDLIEITEKINKKETKQRLLDLEFYIEYLYLLSKFDRHKSDENTDLLLDKIMSKPGMRLLHTYGLYRTFQRQKNIKRPISQTINKSFDIPSSEGIELSIRRRESPEYRVIHPDFYLDSVHTFKPIIIRNTKGLLYVGDNHDNIVKFRALLKPLNNYAGGVIIIRDLEGNHIKDINVPPDNVWRNYNFQLEPGEFYRITFKTPGSELHFQGPNRPFAFNEALYTRYLHKQVPFYFHTPKNQDKVILQIPRKSNRVIVKANDKVLFNLLKNETYTISIDNHPNTTIEILMYRNGVKLQNIPHLISLHEKGVIVQE